MAELGRRMEAAGYPISAPALHRIQGGRTGEPPKEIKLATLNAMLEALNFPVTDFGLFVYEPATPENQAAQPLVVNSDVRLERPPKGPRPSHGTSKPGKLRRSVPPRD